MTDRVAANKAGEVQWVVATAGVSQAPCLSHTPHRQIPELIATQSVGTLLPDSMALGRHLDWKKREMLRTPSGRGPGGLVENIHKALLTPSLKYRREVQEVSLFLSVPRRGPLAIPQPVQLTLPITTSAAAAEPPTLSNSGISSFTTPWDGCPHFRSALEEKPVE